MMSQTVDQIVDKHVSNLIQEIKSHLGEQISAVVQGGQVARGDRAAATPTARTPRSPKDSEEGKTKKTKAEMRCRFTDDTGRCKERSRGPRFRFLCATHANQS